MPYKSGQRKPTIFSYDEVKEKLLYGITVPEDLFMLAVSYANGTRVSEMVGIRRGDIEWNDRFLYVSTPVKKKRTDLDVRRAPPINRRYEKEYPRQAEPEGWLADIIISYAVVWDRPLLIPYGVRTAQRRFEKYFGCTSHSFRHTRVTHCFTRLGMDMRQVTEYFRIEPRTIPDWVVRYGHLDRRALEEHLR